MNGRLVDRHSFWIAPALFLWVFVTHALSPIATSSDSRWTVPLALSLLRQQNLDLDEFLPDMRAHRFGGIECVGPDKRVSAPSPLNGCPPGAKAYYSYPPGTSVLAAPVLAALDAVLRMTGPVVLSAAGDRLTPAMRCFFERRYADCFALTELVIASFLIAAATVVVFQTSRLYLPAGPSLVAALLFAFATPAYSTGSRALWQHGPVMLLLALALYLLARGQRQPGLSQWSALPLVLACFTRPLAAIWVALAFSYLWFRRRSELRNWVLLSLLAGAPFLIRNWLVYGAPFQPYYMHQRFLALTPGSLPAFLSALAGHLVSPSRGLLVFSPILLFSLAGMVLALRRGWEAPLTRYLTAGMIAHWVVVSWFVDWPGGHCYGPRYLSDLMPLLAFFLIPVFQQPRKPGWAWAVFVLLAGWSVLVQYRGAAHWEVYLWNSAPTGASPAHAWDWSDPQFLRGLWGR